LKALTGMTIDTIIWRMEEKQEKEECSTNDRGNSSKQVIATTVMIAAILIYIHLIMRKTETKQKPSFEFVLGNIVRTML
jgi:hypothetical protein